MKKIHIFYFISALVVTPSHAANFNCNGTISNVHVTNYGEVRIKANWNNQYTQICAIGSEWKGVSPDVCKGMLSVALSAQATGRKAKIRYNNVSFDCSTVPGYDSAPSPRYLGIAE